MKKLRLSFILLLTLIIAALCICICSCGGGNGEQTDTEQTSAETTQPAPSTPPPSTPSTPSQTTPPDTETPAPTEFTLSFAPQNASHGSVAAKNAEGADIKSGDKLTAGTSVTLTATASTGYDFEGWYSDDKLVDGGTSATLTVKMPSGDYTLTAKFKAQKRTVTFADGFDTVHTETVDYNTVAHHFDATRPNHSLVGWFVSAADDAAQFSFTTPITEDITLYAKWKQEVVVHDIEFVYEDGRRISLVQVADGYTVQLPGVEERVGYKFDKWCYLDTASGDYVELPSGYTASTSIKITAFYSIESFSVSFYKKQGDTDAYHTDSVEYGKTLKTPMTPTDTELIFTVWLDENGNEFDLSTPITEPIKLYGGWKQKPATTFDVYFFAEQGDGDHLDLKTAESGKTVSLPSEPTKDGHKFAGWYYNDGTEKQFTAETPVTSDMEVYAKYAILTYKVTFVDYDGTVLKAEQTVNHGAAAIPPTEPTRGGYEFDGWDTVYDNVTKDLTVTAKWKILSFEVKYLDGDRELSSTTVDHGKTLTVPQTPEKAGYSFIGWYEDGNFAKKFDFAKTVITEDTEIYALFERIELSKHSVSFLLPDGTVISEQTVVEGNSAIDPGSPQITGYTFKGWDKSFDNITAPTTITAVFEKNKYTVRFFDHNGEQIGTSTMVEYLAYATAPDSFSVPCPENKQLVGWDKNIASTQITKDTDFYAQYAFETRDVTFHIEGEAPVTSKVEYGSRANIPSTPTKPGYVFKYWKLEGSDTAFDFSTAITSDTELYAEFDKLVDMWTVSFKNPQGVTVGNVQLVATGETASEPAPYNDGTNAEYMWCLEGTTQAFDFDATQITGDIVLVATPKQS